MKYVITIILLLFTSHVQASWSGFVHVTPDTEKKYDIEVSISAVNDHKDKLLIRLKAVGYDNKIAWLIITSEELSGSGQNLRSHIWYSAKPEKEILMMTKLMPTGIRYFDSKNTNSKFYEVMIDSDFKRYFYIYIDFPREVKDGGYYYSIDIGAYLKKYQQSANKSIQPTAKASAD